MNCLKCGSENIDNTNFCRGCGAKLERIEQVATESLIKCSKCGHANESVKKFCPKCGTPVIATAPIQTTTEASATPPAAPVLNQSAVKPKPIIGLVAVIVFLIVLGGLGYWYYQRQEAEKAIAYQKQQEGARLKPEEQAKLAQSDPQGGDLCTILNTGRSNLATLNRQIENEKNPLKKDTLQQQIRQINQQADAALNDFFQVNRLQLINYTGKISSIEVQNYNTGPGVMLGIALPCNVNITVQFIEITNPAWGNLDPDSQTPLPPFRSILENLAVNDTVTFSGRLPQDEFKRHFMNSPDNLSFFAVITDLVKGRIDERSVPPLSAEEALRIARAGNAIQSNLQGQLRRRAVLSSGRNWDSWKEFVDAAELLKSTLKKRGWSLSGFQIPGMGYYLIEGNFEPPDSSRKWIVGTTPGEYTVVFLEHAENKVLNLATHGATAEATISAKYSGCTEFCELYKEVRQMPDYIASNIFGTGYNPSFDFDAVYNLTVRFSWDQNRGWHAHE